MPTVSPPAKVLVTGANGYIAAWVVQALLEAGYAVRGTVRSAGKGEHLKALFAGKGDFEVVVVEDITKDGAFDEAVKGVDLVQHIATAVTFSIKHPDELIVPAIKGTASLLGSVIKSGSSVKRVVLTSSVAAILRAPEAPGKWDETSWNEPSVAEYKAKGDKTDGVTAYRVAKTLSEKAAWDIYEKNKPSIAWDLVVLNPSFVFGPPINEQPSLSSLNGSMQNLYDAVVTGVDDAKLASGTGWIDVRDLAQAHVLAGNTAAAGGERIIISAGPFFWQTLADVANNITPAPIPGLNKGNPELIKGKPFQIDFDTGKAARIFGLKPRTLEETIRDSLVFFASLGDK
ncbi:D-lactaldehyde dehydrogenase [Gloeopeniophorella convolvens]|nr:D-lactaldehyde dehydrogenase [Gloeopeniophorella convolvens]